MGAGRRVGPTGDDLKTARSLGSGWGAELKAAVLCSISNYVQEADFAKSHQPHSGVAAVIPRFLSCFSEA